MARSVTAKTLNSSPMPVGPRSVRRARAFVDIGRLGRRRPCLQGGGAGLDAESFEEIALQADAVSLRPAGNGGLGEAMEIHMGGQIRLARLGEGIDEGVPPQRLQGVAIGRAPIAVVEDQGRAACPAPGGGRARPSPRWRPPAIRSTSPGRSGLPRPCSASGRRPKIRRSPSMPTSRSHQPRSVARNWRTGSASKNSLATRSVGPGGTSSSRSCHVKGEAGGGEGRLLPLPQGRARLDEMDAWRPP